MRRKATRIEEIIAAAARSDGRVYVRVGNGTPVAELWLHGPNLIAASAEGGERRLGARLLSTGHLASAELERSRTAAAKCGASLAVALAERVRRDVLTALAGDEARYALAAALAAPQEEVSSEEDRSPEGLFPLLMDAADLLNRTHEFLAAVREAQAQIPPASIPVATEAPSPDMALGPEEWALLSRADGTVTVAMLADECGFPQPEASLIVTRLASMNLLRVEEGFPDSSELLAELEAAEDLAAISAAFEHVAAFPEPDPEFEAEAPEPGFPEASSPEPEAVVVQMPAPRGSGNGVAATLPGDPPASPHGLPAGNGDRTVDTQALLRELASIARTPEEKR
ncbi:MAG TPA: hypothetical protein VM841_03310 [Actinomycetota bacterium]|nr:hypothetical protein [Actinomycetota bacterium]